MTHSGRPQVVPEPGQMVPLSPMQEWFFAQSPVTPTSYTQSNLMRVPGTVSQLSLHAAVGRLAERHDALRLRFGPDRDRHWSQWVTEDPDIPVERHVVAPGGPTSYQATVLSVCRRLRARINLTAGPIAAAALIERPGEGDRDVVLVIHHLAVDAVSWTVLGDELRLMLAGPGVGDAELPAVTTSFARWSLLLRSAAPKWADEAAAWAALAGGRRGSFAAAATAENPAGATTVPMRRATWSFGAGPTRALLEKASTSGTRLDHILLAALGAAVCPLLDIDAVVVDVETHGRADLVEADLTQTVGWLTAISPTAVSASPPSILAEARRIGDRARLMPNGGLGYGALRWLLRDARLVSQDPAAVLFTYLGRSSAEQATWRPAPEAEVRSAFRASPYLLTVNAWVQDEQLFVDWWTAGWLPPGSALPLAAEALVEQLRSVEADAATGADVSRQASSGAAAVTTTEQVILMAWTEVLDAAAPWNEHLSPAAGYGVDDDFFLVGGDSIHMIQVASRLRQALGIRVPLRAVRDFPTIRELATKIDAVVAGVEIF